MSDINAPSEFVDAAYHLEDDDMVEFYRKWAADYDHEMLEKLGYAADLAQDGIEAIEMVQKNEYDLILMDIQMPRMDGLAATEKIIKHFTGRKRPLIIGITAHAANEERERGLAAGMDDYLSKPIQLVKLKEMLWTLKGQNG